MEPITSFSSRIVALPVDNVDTDQVIPARFLKTTSRQGLGRHLFADWRYNADGTPKPDFVLNQPGAAGGRVLVAGNNFGCGSSREHAPWALLDFGFRAVVSTDFADIFRNNALKNGLLPIMVEQEVCDELLRLGMAAPEAEITIDLEARTLTLPGGRSVTFPIDPFARQCLLAGVDQMGFILAQEPLAGEYERSHPARVNTVLAGVGG